MKQDRKKVLVLTSTYPRVLNDSQPGFVNALCQELSDEFDVTVLTPHFSGACTEERYHRVKVVRFRYFFEKMQSLAYGSGILSNLKRNKWNYLLIPFFILSQVLHIRQLLSRQQYDVVHAHWIIPQGVAFFLAKLTLKSTPPVVITSHGGDLFALSGAVGHALQRFVLSKADRVTVVSRFMKSFCIDQLGLSKVKISVMPMGVDLQHRFCPSEPQVTRANKIIFVGRLVEKKGVTILLQAIPLLVERFPELEVTIIGDGILKVDLEDEAVRLGIRDKVKFLGAVRNNDVPGYLNSHLVAIVPSIVDSRGDQEGLGLVAVEAMGCGCVVVASNLPALEDVVIDGENGMFFKVGDSRDLAAKLALVLTPGDLQSQLSKNAREYVLQKFDWRSVANGYSVLFHELSE